MATGNDGSQSMGGSAPPTDNFARTFKYLMGYFVILNSCNLSCTKIIIGLNCFPAFFCFFACAATQFLSRLIPFIFNAWIVRHLTETDYAVTRHFLYLADLCFQNKNYYSHSL